MRENREDAYNKEILERKIFCSYEGNEIKACLSFAHCIIINNTIIIYQ